MNFRMERNPTSVTFILSDANAISIIMVRTISINLIREVTKVFFSATLPLIKLIGFLINTLLVLKNFYMLFFMIVT